MADYEWVVINNSDNRYSIFEAYNEGVRQSKGEMLCFMHDDLLYHTQGWGQKLLAHFDADSQLGILGVVGGHYFPKQPCGWFHSHVVSGGTVQKLDAGSGTIYKKELYNDYLNGNLSIEVVAVDGLWFCIPRRLFFNEIQFDETNFSGFHCYDADISLQVRESSYKAKVAADIDIWHKFTGGCNQAWVESTLQFYEKWKCRLPVEVGTSLTVREKYLIDQFVSDMFEQIRQINELQGKLRNPIRLWAKQTKDRIINLSTNYTNLH